MKRNISFLTGPLLNSILPSQSYRTFFLVPFNRSLKINDLKLDFPASSLWSHLENWSHKFAGCDGSFFTRLQLQWFGLGRSLETNESPLVIDGSSNELKIVLSTLSQREMRLMVQNRVHITVLASLDLARMCDLCQRWENTEAFKNTHILQSAAESRS